MSVNLQDISDEILLHIFQFVDATDLYQLSYVCRRFHDLVRDDFLWTWCEGRSQPNSRQKIEFCEKNVNHRTRVMLLAGDYVRETIVSDEFFKRIGKLKSLTVLALENQYLDGAAVPLPDYLPHLEELSLRNSCMIDHQKFFRRCSELKNLRVLCLDRCCWFDSILLEVISDLKSLEILSLYLCKQLSDYELRYFEKYDFKALKILDVRFTGYGDEVFRMFCNNKSFREIYFQGYSKTFQLECAMRKLEILKGSPAVHHNYLDPFFQVDDTNPVAMIKMFGKSFNLLSYDIQQVTDEGVENYETLDIDLTEEYVPPKSILYKPPYGKCTCGYMGSEPELTESFTIPSLFVADSQRQELETKIALLLNRKEVPDIYFLLVNIYDDEPKTDMELFIMQNRIPTLFYYITSRNRNLPISNVIEVDFRGNVVRLLPRCAVQDSLVSITRVIPIHHDAPAAERNNVETVEALSQPTRANREESSTSQRGTTRKQEEEPCCSKSLIPEKPLEVQEDNLCFKIFSLKMDVNIYSSEDEESANSEKFEETGIRCLSLRGYDRVTDTSLSHMEDLRLDLLDVTLTSVTSAGVSRFRSTNPQCRIIHETACKCRPRMHF